MIIISCFAGCGKNYAINSLRNAGMNVISIEKDHTFKKSEYVKNVKNYMTKNINVLFIPYYLDMETKEIKGEFDYILIHPSICDKDKYLKLYHELEFTDEQIINFEENWSSMLIDCMQYKGHYELKENEYVLDVVDRILAS